MVKIRVLGEYAHEAEASGQTIIDCLRSLAERGDVNLSEMFAEVERLRSECVRLAALAKSESPCFVCGGAATVTAAGDTQPRAPGRASPGQRG